MQRSAPSRCGWICLYVIFMAGLVASSRAAEVDLRPYRDVDTPLANPDKGWYHHYPDNHIDRYRIARDADLLEIPGIDHLYIRLAWAYLEPQEGVYDWAIIDDLVDRWTRRGLGIAFRISCRETSVDRPEQQFATPHWVMEAGAKGGFYLSGQQVGPDGPWEPEFDDPVFLEKLDNFLAAFADRYDGRYWLRYVDVGSIGDWGEGHTHFGSRRTYGFEQRRRHVDLYLKHFKKAQVVVTDDFVFEIPDDYERQQMHQYIIDHGISYRDDSILVDWYVTTFSEQYTVRSPEFFADAYPKTPTILELEHYSSVKEAGNWMGGSGSSVARFGQGRRGPDYFRGALELLHATYIGYHGYADEWFNDNPELTGELLNRCGYWYFLNTVSVDDALTLGETNRIEVEWENRGVAHAYRPYELIFLLEGPERREFILPSGNERWLPAEESGTFREAYELELPISMEPGMYTLKLKLLSTEARDVRLALDPTLLDPEGFYRITEVELVE